MQPITIAQLESVTGGAGTNDLNAWLPQGGGSPGGGGPGRPGGGSGGGDPWGSTGASFGKVTPADSRVIGGGANEQFGRSPNMNVSSGPDMSWQQGLPGMFSAMGM